MNPGDSLTSGEIEKFWEQSWQSGSEAMEEDDVYTKDGTLDYRNRPANKKKTGTWKACPFILGNECSERLAYYGMSSNLMIYFQTRLNQSTTTASKNLSNWSGTCYIMPLVGAFLADSYLGRYWTIASFSIIYVIGMTLMTLSATVPGISPHCIAHDKCTVTGRDTAVCFVALYLVALGTGGIKPCVSSYGADQFDDTDEKERKHKSSFFNWFYFSINIGALVASSLIVWIQQDVSWGWGFGVPAVAMAMAVTFFFSGTRLYRYQKPGGSPFTRLFQVVVASLRKRKVKVPIDKSLLHETSGLESNIQGSRKLSHTNELRFFDKAAVVVESDDHKMGSVSPWRLCTVTQVEELKSIIRLLPIWATGIIFSTVYGQMSTQFVSQAEGMNTYVGSFQIPEASLSVFDTLSVIVWVPIYDRLIVPMARKFTGHKSGLTHLQRMGVGLFISILAMVSAAVLEMVRLAMVKRHNLYNVTEVPISVFWQVPQYFIIGCAEVFTFIGQLEFFYDQAPDSMRSLCSALSLTTNAIGNYLSSFLVTIVTDITTRNGKPGWLANNLNYGHLDYFFWLLAVLSVMNLGVFLVVAKMYTYKKAINKVSDPVEVAENGSLASN